MSIVTLARPGLRERLLERVARSACASRAFVTRRWRQAALQHPAPGVAVRTLYEAGPGPQRAGEPLRVRLIELAPGAGWDGRAPGHDAEWLPMRGTVQVGALTLQALDYHRAAGGALLHSDSGALVYLRESAAHGVPPLTRRDADGGWDDFAPGIRRRVLCEVGGEASMLYRAAAGAAVPRHGHRHDEECLLLDGELFLDDVLLGPGDWQIAPAGTEHGGVQADTEVLLFAHGDLALDLR